MFINDSLKSGTLIIRHKIVKCFKIHIKEKRMFTFVCRRTSLMVLLSFKILISAFAQTTGQDFTAGFIDTDLVILNEDKYFMQGLTTFGSINSNGIENDAQVLAHSELHGPRAYV